MKNSRLDDPTTDGPDFAYISIGILILFAALMAVKSFGQKINTRFPMVPTVEDRVESK
jgi:hypothetical protein